MPSAPPVTPTPVPVQAPPALPPPADAPTLTAPRLKLVRDTFTMPRADHELIGILKDKTAGLKQPARKNELLRAGLHLLLALPPARLLEALSALSALAPVKARQRGKSS